MNFSCHEARERLALLLYGELSFDEEERVEAHLEQCAECRGALDRQQALHAALDAAAVTPSPALLQRSRREWEDLLEHASKHGRPAENGSGMADWLRAFSAN